MMTLTAFLAAQIAAGTLQPDPAQQQAAAALDALSAALKTRRPQRWWQRNAAPRALQGLYIYGPVGRGKTLLMDHFFAEVTFEPKRRVHFHTFMLEVHERLHHWRQSHHGDPIPALAADIAQAAKLLCFDEFQITDVADAMIVARLFGALFAKGVVMVATSNTPPDRLYEHGLQRPLFLPFIDILKQHCNVLSVAGHHDYRRLRPKDQSLWLQADEDTTFEQLFLTMTEGAHGAAAALTVQGRTLTIPRAAQGVAMFSFKALCEQPVGTADFDALAQAYATLFLCHVPTISPERRDVARRFINLIDILYEHQCKLVVLSAIKPEGIYPQGELVKDFERTLSRLHEMQSEAYWQGAHRP